MILRNKLILHVSLVIIVTMSSIMAIVVSRQTGLLQEQALKRGLAIAQSVAAPVSSSLMIYEMVELQQDTTEISSVEDVVYVSVFDNEGRQWAFDSRAGVVKDEIEFIEPPKNVSTPLCVERRDVFQTRHLLDIVTPVYYHERGGGATRVGSIRMGMSLDRLDAQVARIWLNLGLLWFAALGGGILTSSLLARRISRPIEDLVHAADRYARGDFGHRITANGRDEIGLLGRSLDTMARDITAHTEELRVALEKAEEANRAKSEFLANVSHELRTPLHCILSFSRFGTRKAEDGDLKTFFSRIEEGGEGLLELVNNLLDLSSCEAGKMELARSLVDLKLASAQVIGEFHSIIGERGLVINPPDVASDDAQVFADSGKMLRVLRNILGNAVRFSPDGGSIAIAIEADDDTVRLQITDDGPGIPEDETEAIFEKFVQSSATKTGAGGTGLGLAICRSIVDAHDGRIWAENSEQGGARLVVELPRMTADELQPVAAGSADTDGELTPASS